MVGSILSITSDKKIILRGEGIGSPANDGFHLWLLYELNL